jgi:excisionase family DNA binding protein
MKTYSTAKVAKLLGIGTETIYRWMHDGNIPTPPLQSLAGMRVRIWSEDDLEAARKYKATHYWGKAGRRKRKNQAKKS